MMDNKMIQVLCKNWLDEEKRPGMAKGHKQLFELLQSASEETIRDFPKITKVYQKMCNARGEKR